MATCTVCNAEVADDQAQAHMSEMHPDGGDMGGADAAPQADEGMGGAEDSSGGEDTPTEGGE